MKKNILLYLFLITLMLSSCGGFSTGKREDLNGTAWTLVSYNGSALLPETAMTAFFKSGEVNGSASCNHYFGSYEIKGYQIEIGSVGWTAMACMDPEGIMEQEQQVMMLFSQAATFSIEGQGMQIITGTGEVMEFQKIENKE